MSKMSKMRRVGTIHPGHGVTNVAIQPDLDRERSVCQTHGSGAVVVQAHEYAPGREARARIEPLRRFERALLGRPQHPAPPRGVPLAAHPEKLLGREYPLVKPRMHSERRGFAI